MDDIVLTGREDGKGPYVKGFQQIRGATDCIQDSKSYHDAHTCNKFL